RDRRDAPGGAEGAAPGRRQAGRLLRPVRGDDAQVRQRPGPRGLGDGGRRRRLLRGRHPPERHERDRGPHSPGALVFSRLREDGLSYSASCFGGRTTISETLTVIGWVTA